MQLWILHDTLSAASPWGPALCWEAAAPAPCAALAALATCKGTSAPGRKRCMLSWLAAGPPAVLRGRTWRPAPCMASPGTGGAAVLRVPVRRRTVPAPPDLATRQNTLSRCSWFHGAAHSCMLSTGAGAAQAQPWPRSWGLHDWVALGQQTAACTRHGCNAAPCTSWIPSVDRCAHACQTGCYVHISRRSRRICKLGFGN